MTDAVLTGQRREIYTAAFFVNIVCARARVRGTIIAATFFCADRWGEIAVINEHGGRQKAERAAATRDGFFQS